MSATGEQVVRIRQRAVFSATVGSDIPSAGVEAFGCRFEPPSPLDKYARASLGETG